MRKFLIFSVALLTTTLLGTSCQKEDVVAQMDVATTKSENVQKGKTAHVSYKDAIQIATEAVAMLEGGAITRSGIKRRVDPSKIKYHVTPTTRSGEGGDTLYYVVNYADNAGFALVSTSRAEGDPLIAVTEQGNFTPGEETGNPGFDMYIDLLNSRIDDGRPGIDPEFPGYGPFYEYILLDEGNVNPMLTVKWGQGSPYNLECPINEDSTGISPTGCVATAIAQIMSYYEYPTSYVRKYHDEHNTIAQNINWANLKRHIVTSQCDYSCDYISLAQIFHEIGFRANIRYGERDLPTEPYNSWTTTVEALVCIDSFGFAANDFISYTFNAVRADLDNSKPVYMEGKAVGGKNAHAWVVDGYSHRMEHVIEYYESGVNGERTTTNETVETTTLLHINWGWDGEGNGYFRDGVFKPSAPVILDSDELESEEAENYNDSSYLRIISGITPLN